MFRRNKITLYRLGSFWWFHGSRFAHQAHSLQEKVFFSFFFFVKFIYRAFVSDSFCHLSCPFVHLCPGIWATVYLWNVVPRHYLSENHMHLHIFLFLVSPSHWRRSRGKMRAKDEGGEKTSKFVFRRRERDSSGSAVRKWTRSWRENSWMVSNILAYLSSKIPDHMKDVT